MSPLLHPEVLANDWVPPVVIGRCPEVEEVVRRLDPPCPRANPPWIVGIVGPRGSGTSAVARRAAREVVERLRAASATPAPRALAVRVGNRRGTHGVATALLQRLDDGFDGRGFSTAEILAGFLRRVRRENRPTVLVLDDLAGGEPDLAPVLQAIGRPDRFLPEGESGLPPFWTVVAGTPDALAHLHARVHDRFAFGPFVALEPYDERTLGALVVDRGARALGRLLPESLARKVIARAVEDGGGAGRAVELLRRELLRGSVSGFGRSESDPTLGGVPVEPRVVRAIDAASRGTFALVGEVRRWEADLARAQGRRPLPTTTLWRRIVRLERAGYVRREIRTGGSGGTRSLVRVLTPIDEWVTTPHPPDSPRADAPWAETPPPEDPPGSASPDRPGWATGPFADGAD